MLMCIVVLLAQAPACSSGRAVTEDTQGHCCWEAQVWAKTQGRCVGIPVCPLGFRGEKEDCVEITDIPAANQDAGVPQMEAPVEPAIVPPATKAQAAPKAEVAAPARVRVTAPRCPQGELLDETGRCVAMSEGRKYLGHGRFDLNLHVAAEFYTMIQGVVAEFAVTIVRGELARVGLGAGVGLMLSVQELGTTRLVSNVIFPAYAFGGLRLGSASLEVQVRAGAMPFVLSTAGGSLFSSKPFLGALLAWAWGLSGSGLSLGCDVGFINGTVVLLRAGLLL